MHRSIWTCLSLLLALGYPVSLAAQGPVLQVRPAGAEQISREPRQVASMSFAVRNASGNPVEVEPRLILPQGWQEIALQMPFNLGPQQSVVRLVSFLIPEDAASGDFSVTYEVRDRMQLSLVDAYTVRVTVASMLKVQVLPLDAPEFVVAGESYQSAFLIRNVGNAHVLAAYKVRGRRGTRPRPAEGSLTLAPGESQRIDVTVDTPESRERVSTQLSVIAEVAGSFAGSSTSSLTQIVPRASTLDAFHTMGARADMRFVARDAKGAVTTAWQPEVSGGGVIDEENERHVSFRLRGPDTRERGSLGATDEYWLKLESERVTAIAGDFSYGLSTLTEPGRFGRGALFSYRREAWGWSAYEMRDAHGGSGGTRTGVNTHYHLTPATRVDANVLSKADAAASSATIWSLRSQSKWDGELSTDLEVGKSSGEGAKGGAIRAALYDKWYAVRYYLLGWTADADFQGYLRDKSYVSAGFDYPGVLRGYYRRQNWNVEPLDEIDPDLLTNRNPSDLIRAAPTQTQASLGTARQIGASRASLDYILRMRPDVESSAWRAGLGRSFLAWSFSYAFEHGVTRNFASATDFNTSMHMLSASLRAGRSQTYGLYTVRDTGAHEDEKTEPQLSFGVNASYSVRDIFSLGVEAQRNQTPLWRSETYNLSLTYGSMDGGRVKLVARRLEGRFARTDFMLSYSTPFDFPVMRREGIAPLRGRVFDGGSGDGLKNVLLRLDGHTAVSDAEGEFVFPAVVAGRHQVIVERTNVGVDKVPATEQLLDVLVAERSTQPMQIAMVSSATIAITVSFNPGALMSPQSPANVLVALKKDSTTIYRLTDHEGRVQVGGLSPGLWAITVDESTVPHGYMPAREIQLEVKPGETQLVSFTMSPLERKMRMLPPVEVY